VAVQQSKIARKRKADNALNLKRMNEIGGKIDCETASIYLSHKPICGMCHPPGDFG
jgi:hypothetical protein